MRHHIRIEEAGGVVRQVELAELLALLRQHTVIKAQDNSGVIVGSPYEDDPNLVAWAFSIRPPAPTVQIGKTYTAERTGIAYTIEKAVGDPSEAFDSKHGYYQASGTDSAGVPHQNRIDAWGRSKYGEHLRVACPDCGAGATETGACAVPCGE